VSERALEAACRGYARQRGCFSCKLWPTMAGLPDRLFFCPGGRLLIVEFKTRRGRLSPAQRSLHLKFAAVGWTVYVIRTLAEFKTLL
jgi:hypothetical protein